MDIQSSLLSRLHRLYYNLGCVLHQQGKLVDAAQSYYQAIAVQSPEQSSLAFSTADPARPLADRPDSLSDELKFHTIRVLNNLGCLLLQQENWQEAIQVYQQAIELQPEEAALYNNLGRALFQDDPVQAIAAYRKAAELQPDLVIAHHNLGLLLQHQGQHQSALEAFSRVLQIDPDHPKAHNDAAFSHLALGQFEAMIAHLRAAILPQVELIRLYCQTVAQYSGTDQLALAKRSCGRFLQVLLNTELNTDSAESRSILQHLMQTYYHWANTLTAYGGTEQYQRAETFYQRALRIQPDHPALLVGLIDNLIQQQRWNAAIALCHTAIDFGAARMERSPSPVVPAALSQPFGWQFYWQLGSALERQQRFSAAIEAYQKALHLRSPSDTRDGWSAYMPSSLAAGSGSASAPVEQFCLTTLDWIQSRPDLEVSYQSLSDIQLNTGLNVQTDGRSDTRSDIHLDTCLDAQPNARLDRLDCALMLDCDPIKSASLSPDETACAGINCERCLKAIHDRFSPIGLSEQLYCCTPDRQADPQANTQADRQSVTLDPVPLFMVRLPQGRAWTVPQQNDWMVCNATAILTPDAVMLADLSRSYPGDLPGCDNPSPKFHRIFTQSSLPAVETINGTVVALASLSGTTYFHWMVDILPRLELLRRGGLDWAEVDWFWVNGGDAAFQRSTLRQLGIPGEKILSSDRHPYIQAEQLIVPSFASPFGWIEPWGLEFLRRAFLPSPVDLSRSDLSRSDLSQPDSSSADWFHGELPERVYISRSVAKHRQVLNESAVLDRLQPAGFTVVQLEQLSFEAQVAIFAHAKVIIAPHGSGLTNLVFCRPGTVVVELMSPHYIRSYYWVVSHQLRLQHYYLVGESVEAYLIRDLMYQNPLLEDIWIDIDAFDAMLERLNLTPALV